MLRWLPALLLLSWGTLQAQDVPPPPSPEAVPPVPVLVEDPLVESVDGLVPGWFSAVDVGILVPHIKNGLVGSVAIGTRQETVTVPFAELDWNIATRFEMGYRFGEAAGEFLASFRNLNARGRDWLPTYDGGGVLLSRLDANVGDFDYAIRDPSLGPMWDVKWRMGVRVAGVFMDSRTQAARLGERVSNNFVGAGPHVGLDIWRNIGINGLSLFARTEGAVVIGGISQNYEETFRVGTVPTIGGATRNTGVQSVPVLNVQLGVGWTPPGGDRLRVSAGYQYEYGWYLGSLGDARAELGTQGLFIRTEFGF